MRAIYAAFEQEFSEAYSPLGLNPEAGVEIEAFVLKASLPQAARRAARCSAAGPADPAAAQTGSPRGPVLGRGRLGADARVRDGAPGARATTSPDRR